TDPIRARRFAPRPVKGGAILPKHPCRSRFAAQVPGALCPARLGVPVRVRRFSAFRFQIAEKSGDTIRSDLFRKAALVTGASLEAIPPACRLEELETESSEPIGCPRTESSETGAMNCHFSLSRIAICASG